MVEFKELLERSSMNMKQFSECFNIPYRTLQNWKSEERKCPDYVTELIEYKMRKEHILQDKLKNEGMVKDMTDIEILMEDGCTREDAQRHLEVGTIVFDDFEDHLDSYCAELAKGDEEFEEELRKMVETKEPAPDWGIVESSGKTYYIMYCL